MDHDFEENINELRMLHAENEKVVNNELKSLINRLKYNKNDMIKIFSKDFSWDILLLCILSLLIAALGFFSQDIGLYLFGVIFFLAGFFIGLFVKGFGLIFLLSHGGTGLCILIGSILSRIWNSPVLTDGYHPFFLYFGVAILLFIIATALTVIHNLSEGARRIRYFKVLPLALFFTGIVITEVVVHMFS